MPTTGNASSNDTCVMTLTEQVFAGQQGHDGYANNKIMTHDAFLPVDGHYTRAQTVNRNSCHDASWRWLQ